MADNFDVAAARLLERPTSRVRRDTSRFNDPGESGLIHHDNAAEVYFRSYLISGIANGLFHIERKYFLFDGIL